MTPLKVVLVLLVPVAAAIGLIIWLSAAEYKPQAVEELALQHHVALEPGEVYCNFWP